MTGIGIIGIGGFAASHLKSIKKYKNLCTLEAAVIRSPDKYKEAITALRKDWPAVRIYPSLEDMLEEEQEKMQLVAIPTGIPSHRKYSVACLNKGYHVICEKPVAGTMKDALAMKKAQDVSGKVLAIGFQNIFSPSIQRIKGIADSGSLGKLRTLKSTARWKRTSIYYNRNDWAGCLKDGDAYVYDSPIQNATAHYLQNLLYIAGDGRYDSALPATIYGENYHAQAIESADTQFIRCRTSDGKEISFAVTHACETVEGPHAEFLFDRGRITWSFDGNRGSTRIYDEKGTLTEELDNGADNVDHLVFGDTLRALEEGRMPLCHIGNAYQHTVCVNYLFRASPIHEIPSDQKSDLPPGEEAYGSFSSNITVSEDDCNTVIKGIDEAMTAMYEKGGISYFEAGLPWGRRGNELKVNLEKDG